MSQFEREVIAILGQELSTRLRQIVPVDTGRLKNTVRVTQNTLKIDPVSPVNGFRYGQKAAGDVVEQYFNSDYLSLLNRTINYVIKKGDY